MAAYLSPLPLLVTAAACRDDLAIHANALTTPRQRSVLENYATRRRRITAEPVQPDVGFCSLGIVVAVLTEEFKFTGRQLRQLNRFVDAGVKYQLVDTKGSFLFDDRRLVINVKVYAC